MLDIINKEFAAYIAVHNTLPAQRDYPNHFPFTREKVRRAVNKLGLTINEYIHENFGIFKKGMKISVEDIKLEFAKYLQDNDRLPKHADYVKHFPFNYPQVFRVIRRELDLTVNEFVIKEFGEQSVAGASSTEQEIKDKLDAFVKEQTSMPHQKDLYKELGISAALASKAIRSLTGKTLNEYIKDTYNLPVIVRKRDYNEEILS